jgi:hypothetical protein
VIYTQKNNIVRGLLGGQPIKWSKEKRTKGQTTIYKTLHKKLKIEQHESH